MQDFDLGEPDLAQQVQLKQQRAWRVFLLDVGEHMVPVASSFSRVRYSPYSLVHERPGPQGSNSRPDRTPTASRQAATLGGTQRRHPAIPGRFVGGASTAAASTMSNSPSGSSTSRMSPWMVVMRPAVARLTRSLARSSIGWLRSIRVASRFGRRLQQLEGVVAGSAAHVEDMPGLGSRGRCRLGDQRHRQRRIDRGRLAGFEVGEPLNIGVETLPDLINR